MGWSQEIPITESDVRALTDVGADLNTRFGKDGRRSRVKLLEEEVELLGKASQPYNPIFQRMESALNAALRYLLPVQPSCQTLASEDMLDDFDGLLQIVHFCD